MDFFFVQYQNSIKINGDYDIFYIIIFVHQLVHQIYLSLSGLTFTTKEDLVVTPGSVFTDTWQPLIPWVVRGGTL